MNVIPALDAWLDEKVEGRLDPDSQPIVELKTRLDHIAHCFAKNGLSLTVSGWGIHSANPNLPTGELGLTMNEALHLVHTEGVLQGFVRASDNDPCVAPHFFQRIETTMRRFYAERGMEVPWDKDGEASPA